MHTEEIAIHEMDLVDLYAVGWLIKETDEYITLGMEFQDGAMSARLAQSIPKVNIIQRHEFGIPRRRKPRIDKLEEIQTAEVMECRN